jgi:hypothetical protein
MLVLREAHAPAHAGACAFGCTQADRETALESSEPVILHLKAPRNEGINPLAHGS